jgi:hypothetical protein
MQPGSRYLLLPDATEVYIFKEYLDTDGPNTGLLFTPVKYGAQLYFATIADAKAQFVSNQDGGKDNIIEISDDEQAPEIEVSYLHEVPDAMPIDFPDPVTMARTQFANPKTQRKELLQIPLVVLKQLKDVAEAQPYLDRAEAMQYMEQHRPTEANIVALLNEMAALTLRQNVDLLEKAMADVGLSVTDLSKSRKKNIVSKKNIRKWALK